MNAQRRQLLLDLHLTAARTLDNFVPGGNLELLDRLESLAEPACGDAIYLWGPPGCGRSHLLAGAAAMARRPVANLVADDWVPESVAEQTLLVADDVETLDADAQARLFRLFNDARRRGLSILLAGLVPPGELVLREDLRTRIGQCLIFEVKPLSDDEKADALARYAADRAMRLDAAVVPYLLRYGRRDLPSLLGTLEALDRASLELKRPPTVPLLREILQLPTDLRQSP